MLLGYEGVKVYRREGERGVWKGGGVLCMKR